MVAEVLCNLTPRNPTSQVVDISSAPLWAILVDTKKDSIVAVTSIFVSIVHSGADYHLSLLISIKAAHASRPGGARAREIHLLQIL
jgi:hypothetical protein